MAGGAMDICLRVLKESNKSRFDSYSVRNKSLIISLITFRDCRVHSFCDNLSRNSCIWNVWIAPCRQHDWFTMRFKKENNKFILQNFTFFIFLLLFFFLHFLSDWKKINHETVCYEAKNSHGSFRITKQGLIHTFKLVHRRGSLKCAQHIPATFWGCPHDNYGDQTLSTVITYENKSVLPLAEYRDHGYCKKYSYKIKGIDVNSTELLFDRLPSPISVSNGQVFKIWYTEALLNKHNCYKDNSGKICIDVYALYDWTATKNVQVLRL